MFVEVQFAATRDPEFFGQKRRLQADLICRGEGKVRGRGRGRVCGRQKIFVSASARGSRPGF